MELVGNVLIRFLLLGIVGFLMWSSVESASYARGEDARRRRRVVFLGVALGGPVVVGALAASIAGQFELEGAALIAAVTAGVVAPLVLGIVIQVRWMRDRS